MDALKDFSMEILEWVLHNFSFDTSSKISILGITPYLNIPCKSLIIIIYCILDSHK